MMNHVADINSTLRTKAVLVALVLGLLTGLLVRLAPNAWGVPILVSSFDVF